MAPTVTVRIETITQTSAGYKYDLVCEWEAGQARGQLIYSSEPTQGQLEKDIRAWYKDLQHGSPPLTFNVPTGGGP
jgi:hypothetical protein